MENWERREVWGAVMYSGRGWRGLWTLGEGRCRTLECRKASALTCQTGHGEAMHRSQPLCKHQQIKDGPLSHSADNHTMRSDGWGCSFSPMTAGSFMFKMEGGRGVGTNARAYPEALRITLNLAPHTAAKQSERSTRWDLNKEEI